MEAPFPFAGESLAASSSLLWAVGALLFTRLPRSVSPAAMNLGKNVVGSVGFLALLAFEGVGDLGRASAASWGWLALGGFLGLALCDNLLLRSFRELGPRRTNIVMALSPVLVAAIAMLPPLFERPDLQAGLGMLACLTALGLALRERHPFAGATRRGHAVWRDAFLAAGLQALGIVFTRLGMQEGAFTVTAGAALRLLAGTAGVAMLGLPGGRLRRWIAEIRPARVARPLAFAALIGTVGGIWTNQAGIAWAAYVGVAATLNALTPVWLVPLSRAFLGEHHDVWAWISAGLAVLGIALVSM